MNQKVQSFAELAVSTAKQITSSYTKWTAFLDTAARLYKYPYHEQVLIYAQRPDATACASFDVWNGRMNRAVRRGSRGIALMDTSSGAPRLHYVFDISDTVGRDKSRRPYLWQLEDDNQEPVVQALSDQYDISADIGLEWQLESIAATLSEEYWQENQADILASVSGSFLEELDEDNIKASFCDAASVSTLYVLLTRCGLDASQTLGHEDFLSVFDFNTPAIATALGTAVSQGSEQVLRQIEITIKNFERSKAHERVELSAGGGFSSPTVGDGTAPAVGQIREDAAGLPAGASPGAVQPDDFRGDVGPALDGDRADGGAEIGADDAAATEVHGDNRAVEGPGAHEVGGSDEQRQAKSGGGDFGRAGVQLEQENGQFSLFDTGAFEPLPDARPAGESAVSQDVIDEALRIGANETSSRIRIVAEFMKGKSLQENAEFLEKHYGENGVGFYVGERKYALWYNDAGLAISPGEAVSERFATYVTWEQAASRIKELLEAGEYAGQVTLYRAWPYERRRVAEALQYLHRDISEEYKSQYLPTLTAALDSIYVYPDVVNKTIEMLDDPEKLRDTTEEFSAFMKDYAHNRDILRFHFHRQDDILQGLKDLQLDPLKFTAAEDFSPQRRLFISQDEIDNLLRESPSHNEYRIGVVKFFEFHPDKKERENYLAHLHGEYIGYGDGNDSITYTSKQLVFNRGGTTEPYAKVELKWNKVRKRIEELIARDAFLSAEDKKIMEGRASETIIESASPLDRAKELIEEFCQSEYGTSADFSDLSHVDIAYSTTEDGEHEIQIYTDLADFRLIYEVDSKPVFRLQCFDLDDLNEYLGNLEFDTMIADAEKWYREEIAAQEQTELPAEEPLTDLQKQAAEIAKGYESLSLQGKIDIIAQAFGCTSGEIETSPCSGKWRGTSDISIRFDNGASLFIGNAQTPQAKTAKLQDEYVAATLTRYNPEIIRAAKEAALPTLLKREAVDNAIAVQKGLKPYEILSVEINDGSDERNGGYIGWYYVMLAVEGKIFAHLETGLNHDIAFGKVSETPSRENYFVAGGLKETDVDYVFNNVGHSSTADLYTLPLRDDVHQRAEKVLAEREAVQESTATVGELYEKYKPLVQDAVSQDTAYRNACHNSDEENARLEGNAAIKRAVDGLGDLELTKLYYDVSSFHSRLHHEVLEETYAVLSTPVAPLPIEDDFSDINPAAVRAALEERGIVNGKVVDPEKLNADPFIQQVMADVEQLAAETDTSEDFSVADLENANEDILDVLAHHVLTDETKDLVFGWLREGVDNERLALQLQEHLSSHADMVELETGETVDFFATVNGIEIDFSDKYNSVATATWAEIAEIVRAMYQQELDGNTHDQSPPKPVQPEISTKTVAVYPADKNNLPFDIVIETLHINEPEQAPAPQNFHITDDNLGAGGAKIKFQMNMDAIKLVKELTANGRQATPDEQEVLSKYVGWGGLPDAFDENKPAWASEYKELQEALTPEEYASARGSILNAHYTRPDVIRAIYQTLENMGFRGGNILEPSCGVGNFFGCLPESMADSRLYGVELDSITGQIAKQLYPQADIKIAGFETTDRRNFYDIAIGNVPFGSYHVHDPAYNKLGFSIHNYFFAKALDQVRPGGIVAFLTSRYTMDAKDTFVRKYLSERADLLGAIRLPNGTFKANAGTEVIEDILFLQKRETPALETPAWVETGETPLGFTINQYFIENPHMVLGTEKAVSSQYKSKDYSVAPIPGIEIGEILTEAITNIHGQYVEAALPDLDLEDGEPMEETLPADPDVKNFSYTIVDGDVYYQQNSIMVKQELNKTATQRVAGMVGLRECVRRLINQQLDGFVSDASIKETQQELDHLYDDFSAKFGLINDANNRRAFSQDSSYYLLCALEVLDDEGKFVRKADMFSKRTIQPHQVVTHVDTATEALAVSIGERAKIDLPFMAQLTDKGEDEIIEELRGQIFRVPLQNPPKYVPADEYLSGNVREKLAVAQAVAAHDPSFQINVNALAEVQPKDLDASEIDVRLGATWVDTKYFEQFMYEFLETPLYAREKVRVSFSRMDGTWNISHKSAVPHNDVAAYTTYGTDQAGAYRLLEDALNLRDTQIYDTVEDADGKEHRVLNSKETMLAQEKQALIKQGFRDWIFRDPERRQTLVHKYNMEMNCIRPREYDGSHLVLAGMNPEITLEPHQLNAIARAVYGGNTLFAHCVGAGKTFEMTASAMEMKRLGLCSKSMIVVPNHLTQQWATEFLTLYPNANILVTSKRDFERDKRKKFCARIATGDYDAIIIGYSQFEKIPVSKGRQVRLLQQEIADIIVGIAEDKMRNGENYSRKNMERKRKSLEARLEKLQAEERKDDVICFEELGVDRLFVDESDTFKNLFFVTKMNNVAGLSNTESQRASDMFMKTRYLDEITGSKGVVFATGTPISNSIAEMYTVQRYLQYETLKAMGMDYFDSWASRFGETVTSMELAPEGTGYRPRTRFAKFYNLPELMNIFHEVADIKTEDMLNLPVPHAVFHNVVAHPSEFQKKYMGELSERATAIRSRLVDSRQDNMLKITSDGRKLGLDQRLLNPLAGDDPGSKVNLCVDNILQIWEQGDAEKLTQLVFCDLSTPGKKRPIQMVENEQGVAEMEDFQNVYEDIKQKLIAGGMPAQQIAFIHDANTDLQKKELFARVRSGRVRVLLGSTEKLGAGTNVQDRLIALHNLDCPWRPRDLTQREGRIKRRGNQNPEVHIFRYVTENTFDSYLWQTVEKKQNFISQILTSKSPVRSCEDVDNTALDYAEVKALCAGDPRIKERMELDVEVSKLKILEASHRSQQYRLEDQVRIYFPKEQARLEQQVEGLKEDIALAAAHPQPVKEFAGIELYGQMHKERAKAGAILRQALQGLVPGPAEEIGQYRGFKLLIKRENYLTAPKILLRGRLTYAIEQGDSALGDVLKVENSLKNLYAEAEDAKQKLENVKQQFVSAKAEIGKPFPQEQELEEKTARMLELDRELQLEDTNSDKKTENVKKSA